VDTRVEDSQYPQEYTHKKRQDLSIMGKLADKGIAAYWYPDEKKRHVDGGDLLSTFT
jgi:hypothetical protein